MFKKFGFDFSNIRGDIFGGVTAGVVALPLALAFGVQSGLGATAGLYGAIIISFFAALFGGTPTQISGPTAPMTALSMGIIAGIIASFDGDVNKAIPAILMVFLLSGLIQIGLGFLGLGKYIRYIPYPVVSGFMTAIGVIIILTQILPSLGYYPGEDNEFAKEFKAEANDGMLTKILTEEKGEEDFLILDNFKATVQKGQTITPDQVTKESKTLAASKSSKVIGAVKAFPRAIQNIDWLEFLLALGTIFIIFGFKRITKVIPSTLVALVVMTLIAVFSGYDYRPITEIPRGFPKPNFEIFTNISIGAIAPYFFSAILLALLGAIDSLLTSVVADNMTKTKHKPNTELIGQGIGNSIAALFGGIPGAGATIRTVVNINAGGKTKLSGMIAGLMLLFIMLVLSPVASLIPKAVLAGILITVGIGVMDYKGLRAIPYMPKPEVIIMLIVLVLSSVWNLVYAVGIGLVIAALMFMKKIGDQAEDAAKVTTLVDEEAWSDEKDFPTNLKEEVFIKHLDGPLFFGSTSGFQSLAQQIPKTATAVIIRMSKVPYMDQSGLYALEDVLVDLAGKNIKVLLVQVKEQPHYMMERIDIIPDLIPPSQIFKSFDDCLQWVTDNVEDIYDGSSKKAIPH